MSFCHSYCLQRGCWGLINSLRTSLAPFFNEPLDLVVFISFPDLNFFFFSSFFPLFWQTSWLFYSMFLYRSCYASLNDSIIFFSKFQDIWHYCLAQWVWGIGLQILNCRSLCRAFAKPCMYVSHCSQLDHFTGWHKTRTKALKYIKLSHASNQGQCRISKLWLSWDKCKKVCMLSFILWSAQVSWTA